MYIGIRDGDSMNHMFMSQFMSPLKIVYTYDPEKGLPYDYFGAPVCTIELHGHFGFQGLAAALSYMIRISNQRPFSSRDTRLQALSPKPGGTFHWQTVSLNLNICGIRIASSPLKFGRTAPTSGSGCIRCFR